MPTHLHHHHPRPSGLNLRDFDPHRFENDGSVRASSCRCESPNTVKTRETAVTGHGTHAGPKSGHRTRTRGTRDPNTAGAGKPVLFPKLDLHSQMPAA
jgi:hypothetical protein